MEIMKATAKDLDAAYKLMCELEEEELPFEAFRKAYLLNLDNPDKEYFIAAVEGIAIGFLSLAVDYRLFCADRIVTIDELVVAKEHRSVGIGKELLSAADEYAKDKGCSFFCVTSATRRERAHKFYENNGYEKSGYRFGKAIDIGCKP